MSIAGWGYTKRAITSMVWIKGIQIHVAIVIVL